MVFGAQTIIIFIFGHVLMSFPRFVSSVSGNVLIFNLSHILGEKLWLGHSVGPSFCSVHILPVPRLLFGQGGLRITPYRLVIFFTRVLNHTVQGR